MKFSKFTWFCIIAWLLSFVLVLFNFFRFIADYSVVQMELDQTRIELDQTRMELASLEYDMSTSCQEYLGEFTITHYDACNRCCGKSDGITKSGAKVCEGVTVAVDPSVIPLGTYIYIEGVGYRVAQDTGSAIKGNRIDVYVSSHSTAWELGKLDNIKVWRMS